MVNQPNKLHPAFNLPTDLSRLIGVGGRPELYSSTSAKMSFQSTRACLDEKAPHIALRVHWKASARRHGKIDKKKP